MDWDPRKVEFELPDGRSEESTVCFARPVRQCSCLEHSGKFAVISKPTHISGNIERALHAASYRMACWPLPMVQTYADAHL